MEVEPAKEILAQVLSGLIAAGMDDVDEIAQASVLADAERHLGEFA